MTGFTKVRFLTVPWRTPKKLAHLASVQVKLEMVLPLPSKKMPNPAFCWLNGFQFFTDDMSMSDIRRK